MKNTLILLYLSLVLCGIGFAKDKDKDKEKADEKPILTAEQKLEIVRAQRDLANAIVQAQPGEIRVQQMQQVLNDAAAKATKDIDQAKWKLDANTLEFSAVPQKAEEKPASNVPPPTAPEPAKSDSPKESKNP